MTYFVEPLASGEEAITEYLPVESTDSIDELNSSSATSMGLKKMVESSASLVKATRSPSLSTNASFSLIEPMNSEVNSLWRKNYSSQKKISVESNSSTNHIMTVPIIEESLPNSSTSGNSSSTIRRNQVSPLCNKDEIMQDPSFQTNTAFNNQGSKPKKVKRQNSGKKCTIS